MLFRISVNLNPFFPFVSQLATSVSEEQKNATAEICPTDKSSVRSTSYHSFTNKMTSREISLCSAVKCLRRSRLQSAERGKASIYRAVKIIHLAVSPLRPILQHSVLTSNVIMQFWYLVAGILTQVIRATEKTSTMFGNCCIQPCDTEKRISWPSTDRVARRNVSRNLMFAFGV